MNDEPRIALDEDAIVEAVLEGSADKRLRLLSRQPEYMDFARDIQTLTEGLKSIEDEQPPPFAMKKIIGKNDRFLFSWLTGLPLEWYKNPFILSFGFVLAVIFFYFFMVFFLK